MKVKKAMRYKGLKVTIGIITGFIALTAIGGGIALLSGAEGSRFPLDWLQGTPFKDYTIPALLLSIAVGGSSLAACISIFRKSQIGTFLSLISGTVMVGFISIEVLILKQLPPGPTPVEKLYFALRLTVILLAGWLWLKEGGVMLQSKKP